MDKTTLHWIQIVLLLVLIWITAARETVVIDPPQTKEQIVYEITKELEAVPVDSIRGIDSALAFIRARYGLSGHRDSSENGQ